MGGQGFAELDRYFSRTGVRHLWAWYKTIQEENTWSFIEEMRRNANKSKGND